VAEADIFIDCDQAAVVTSATDSGRKLLPRIVQGDTILLRIRLLKNFARSSGYEEIPTSGLTLQVALIRGVLTSSASVEDSIVASQYTWTEGDDGLYFEAELALNTEEIDTALGSSNSFDAILEVKYLRSAVPTTVLQQAVKVWRAGIEPDSVMAVVEPTPLSAEAAQATFVRVVDETRPIYLMNSSSGVRCKLWIDTDGTFHADPVV
jgi:hypothetical protein